MWTEIIQGISPEATLRGAEEETVLAELEAALGCRIPSDLRSLLLEVGGVSGRYGLPVVWGAREILQENRELRNSPDLKQLYMSFDPILFFGGGPGGDLFGFVREPERDDDVFVWDHESDGRWRVAFSLQQYLERSLGGPGGDWFRREIG
ncbi:SMI1/KNR4 family protein [Streptomyces sp. NPDC003233]